METAEVRAIVEREASGLMDRLGVSYWTVYFRFDLRASTADQTIAGYCERNTSYDIATISLVPAD